MLILAVILAVPVLSTCSSAGGGSLPPVAETTAVSETVIYSNNNIAGVINNPTGGPTTFTVSGNYRVTLLTDYHWNNGQGAPAGTIGLKDSSGKVIGTWQVTVRSGVYWDVKPNIVIGSGTYTVIDSDPSTWAQNSQSKGSGIIEVRGVRKSPETVFKSAPLPVTAPSNLPKGFSSQTGVSGTRAVLSSSPTMKSILSGVSGKTVDISKIPVSSATTTLLQSPAYVRGSQGVQLTPPKGYVSGQNLGAIFYITLPLEDALLQGATSSNMGVICSTEHWTAFIPGVYDKKTHTVSVPTNHLSYFFTAKQSKSQEMAAYFKQQGILMARRAEDWAKDKAGDILLDGVKEFLENNDLDKNSAGKILRSIANNKDSLEKIYEGASASDVQGAALSTQLLIGKIITENVPESDMRSLLSGLIKHADIAADASQAAGSFAGGDYYKASETIGKIIWKKSPVGKSIDGAIAAETAAWEFLTQNQFDAAFQKYKENGSDGLVRMFSGPAAYVREKFFHGQSVSDDAVTQKMEELFETAKRQEEKAQAEQVKLEKMYALFNKMEDEGGASGMLHDFRLSREKLGVDGESAVFNEFLNMTRRIQRDLRALGIDPWLLGRTLNSANPDFSNEALALLAAFSRGGQSAYKAKLAEIAKTKFPVKNNAPTASSSSATANRGTSPFDGIWHTMRKHYGCCTYSASEDVTFSTDKDGMTTTANSDFCGNGRGRVTGKSLSLDCGIVNNVVTAHATLKLSDDGKSFSGKTSSNKHQANITGTR